jgi:hypothetical protein
MKILLIEPAKSPRTIGGEDVYLSARWAHRLRTAYLDHEDDT